VPRRFEVLICLVVAAFLPLQAQSVEIIVHPDSDITSVSRTELSKIFLGKLRTWADHTPAVPIDQVPGSRAREDFTRWVHDRSVVNVEVYWKRQIFSGRGVPPPEVTGTAAVIEFVRTHPGAVGYVLEPTTLRGVRRLEVAD